MFTINSVSIENDIMVSNVTLVMDDKSTLVVNVPVKFPQSHKEVLAAILYRETLEKLKYNAAPTLTVVKATLDTDYVSKAQNSAVVKELVK